MPRILTAVFLVAASVASSAAAERPAGVTVEQAWSRPAASGTTGVGYLTLVNRSRDGRSLVKVESPWATRGEMHLSATTGGVMRMASERAVSITPGRTVFAPGGRHLMFVGLKRPLAPGDRLPATLTFGDGTRLKVTFAVGDGLGPPSK